MSYYERLSKEYGDMGSGNVSNILGKAKDIGQEAMSDSTNMISTLRNKSMGAMGKIIGEKVGGQYLMGMAKTGVQKYIVDPKRLAMNKQATQLKGDAEGFGQQAEDIYTTGRGRMSQGTNADGSLTADKGMTARDDLDQNIKFREGDVLPEDIARDPDGAMAGVDKLSSFNKDRYNNLDATSQTTAKADISQNPNWRSTSDINADRQAGTITRDQAESQRMNSKMIEQDSIGDAEEGSATHLTGANPFSGQTVRSTGGRDVTGQMGDTPTEALDRTTGLTTAEQTTADGLTTAEIGATEGATELGGATLAETALSAVPIIGEIVGLGVGLGEGLHDGIKTAKETAQQTLDIKGDEMNVNNAVKYAGFDRPNFGSMALPSFDTSHSSALLTE
tara:strand:+ start:2160 stop:3332 length:1173 start_codon:yes stop_codon:yes gene_type:complete